MSSRKKPSTRTIVGTADFRRKPTFRRPPRASSIYTYKDGLSLSRLAKPSAIISCVSPLTVTQGTIKSYTGAYTHSGPDYVIFMAPGFGFGGIATAVYVPVRGGYAFTATQYFCYVQKCGNGAPSTHNASIKGTILTKGAITTIYMSYEVLGYCGNQIACSEEGTFKGNLTPESKGSLDGGFIGRADWALRCCPDLAWKSTLLPG